MKSYHDQLTDRLRNPPEGMHPANLLAICSEAALALDWYRDQLNEQKRLAKLAAASVRLAGAAIALERAL